MSDNDYLIRLIEQSDETDLFKVYSDKHALPYFNGDNCHGSNFYCSKMEDMHNTIKYWLMEYYETHGFVRFAIIDKHTSEAVGTIEMFNRKSDDYYNGCGLLRLDIRTDYETVDRISSILSIITEPFYEMFDCHMIITKAPLYAVDRIEALKQSGYICSDEPLIAPDGRKYYDYWMCTQ